MPHSRRRPWGLLLALALTGALASACAQDEKQAEPGATGRTVKLEFWTMQLKPTFTGYIEGLITEWEKTHPEVDVVWTDLPSNEIENKTLAAAAGSNPPDLVNLNPAFANKLANAKALKTLDVSPELKNEYFEAAWEANTFNGQVLGIPWYLSTSVTLYNQEIWERAGLKVGEWPKTFAEMGAVAKTIKDQTQAHALMPNFGDRGKFMEILAQEGVPLLVDGAPAFNTPEGARVLGFWVDLFKNGLIPRESVTQGHREAIDRFQAGQTALFPAGPQFLNIIKQNSPQLYAKLDVGPQITGASGKVGVGVMNLVILKSAKQQDLALDLAKTITSGPNQLAFAKLVPILPSVKSAAADPYFKAAEGADLETRARALAAEQLQRATLLVPPMPRQSELSKSLDDALQRAALGQQTPQAALDQAAQEWKQILGR